MANEIEIDSYKDFEMKFNYRTADRCCANCKHGENEYDGCCTCRHRERFDLGRDADSRIMSYNVMQCNVCDAWEAKEVNNGK